MSQLEKSEKSSHISESHEHATHALQKEFHQTQQKPGGDAKSASGSASAGAGAELAKGGVISNVEMHTGVTDRQKPAESPKSTGQEGKAGGDANHSGAGKGDARPAQGADKGRLSDEDVKNIKDALDKMKNDDLFKGAAKPLQDGNSKAELSPVTKRQIEDLMKGASTSIHGLEELKKIPPAGNVNHDSNPDNTPGHVSDKNPDKTRITSADEKKWIDDIKKNEGTKKPQEQKNF